MSVGLCDKEQHSEWFLKLNPSHQVPVLRDGDFILTESRAIACYLVNLNPQSSLYPTDPKKRAIVDQMLYMDATYIVPTCYSDVIVSFVVLKTFLFMIQFHLTAISGSNHWWIRQHYNSWCASEDCEDDGRPG